MAKKGVPGPPPILITFLTPKSSIFVIFLRFIGVQNRSFCQKCQKWPKTRFMSKMTRGGSRKSAKIMRNLCPTHSQILQVPFLPLTDVYPMSPGRGTRTPFLGGFGIRLTPSGGGFPFGQGYADQGGTPRGFFGRFWGPRGGTR